MNYDGSGPFKGKVPKPRGACAKDLLMLMTLAAVLITAIVGWLG